MELLSKACVSPSNTQWCIPLLGTGYSLRLGGKRRKKSRTGSCQLAFKSYGVLSKAIRYVSRSLKKPSEAYSCLMDSRILAAGASGVQDRRRMRHGIGGIP